MPLKGESLKAYNIALQGDPDFRVQADQRYSAAADDLRCGTVRTLLSICAEAKRQACLEALSGIWSKQANDTVPYLDVSRRAGGLKGLGLGLGGWLVWFG